MCVIAFGKNKLLANIWFVFFFNVLFFSIMAWLLPISFEENDDVLMCMLADGAFSGRPDGHLVFINAIYGWAVAGLYMLAPAFEWYTASFCILHVLAMTAVVRLLATDDMRSGRKALFLALMYVLWIRIVLSFQFTTTAGLLCFSGCLALLRPSAKWRVAGVLAIFVAGLIRFNLAALVCILFAPLFLHGIFVQRRLAAWLFAAAVLSLAGRQANGLFYRDSDWAYYMAYNRARAKIHDNPNARLVNRLDGVDEEDIEVFLGFEGDPTVMDLPVLEELKAKIDREATIPRKLSNAVHLKTYGSVFFLLLAGVVAAVWLHAGSMRKTPRPRTDCAVLAVSFLLFAALAVYLGLSATLKNRVFVCMLMAMAYLAVRLFPDTREEPVSVRIRMAKSCLEVGLFPKNRGSYGEVCVCLVLLGLIFKYTSQNQKFMLENRRRAIDFAANERPLVENYSGFLYPSLDFSMNGYSPFGIKDIPFRMVGLGWLERIPFGKGVWEKHLDFVDSEVLYFGKANDPPVHIMDRITHNYGVAVEAVPVRANKAYALYKIVSK